MERQAYQKTADLEDHHWWFVSRRRLFMHQVERAAGELGLPPDRLRILDYGCGTGYNLRFLARYGAATGADLATEEVERVSKRGAFPFLDLGGDLSGHAGRYPLVTLLDVLEHAADDVGLLEQVRDLMSDDGRLVITVPAFECLWSGQDIMSLHHRRYTAGRLRTALRAAGFRELFLSYYNLLVLPAIAAVIWGRRLLFPARWRQGNLEPTPEPLNAVLTALAGFEADLVGRQAIAWPLGHGLVCRARKDAAA